jgi:hypothetical protein
MGSIVGSKIPGCGEGHCGHPLSDITDGTSVTMMIGERDFKKNIAGNWVGRDRTTSSVGFRVVKPINYDCKQMGDCWSRTCGRYKWKMTMKGEAGGRHSKSSPKRSKSLPTRARSTISH